MRLALATVSLVLLATAASAQTTLRITDKKENVVELTEPRIEYGATFIERERGGFRVKQGSGEVTVAWSRIKEIRFEGNQATVVLRAGDPVKADHSGGNIKGTTSLGDYSIYVGEIRLIEVNPVSKPRD